MDRRVTILESIERKSQMKEKEKTKVNQFGNRIIENWCEYANELAQLKREKARKIVVVSAITEKDRKIFHEAFRKLKRERARQHRPLRLTLKRLASSRSIGRVKSERKIKSENFCTIDYKQAAKPKSVPAKPKSAPVKKQKSKLAIEPKKPKKYVLKVFPIKRKEGEASTEKQAIPATKPKPLVVYPPVKTRPWFPCASRVKPINKPVIEYPPLTLKKW